MSSPPSLVPIPVRLLSGRGAVIRLPPSDTVAELDRRVEEELEVPCFHEARLSLGQEPLRPDLPVADLVERLKGGAGHVEVVVGPSASKARAAIDRLLQSPGPPSAHESVPALAEKYAPALKVLIELGHNDFAIGSDIKNQDFYGIPQLRLAAVLGDIIKLSSECESCRQFATMFLILRFTRVHDGCRQLDTAYLFAFREPDLLGYAAFINGMGESKERLTMLLQREEFDQFVIAAIRTPIGLDLERWSAEQWLENHDISITVAIMEEFRAALTWLAERHPRAAVRAAASEKIAAHLTPAAENARQAAPAREAPAREAPAAARPAEAAAASTEQEVNELAEAVSISDQEALQQEGQQVIEAVMRSKADQWNADGVVLARLTCFRPEIMEFLRSSEHLAACRARVADAGCEQSPAWAGGALILVPATREQIEEAGIGLSPHHVLMLSGDRELVQQALGGLPRRVRPKLMPEHHPEGQGAPAREHGGARGTPRGAEAAGQGSSPTAQPASYEGAPAHELGRSGG